jgi:hypothetical protein
LETTIAKHEATSARLRAEADRLEAKVDRLRDELDGIDAEQPMDADAKKFERRRKKFDEYISRMREYTDTLQRRTEILRKCNGMELEIIGLKEENIELQNGVAKEWRDMLIEYEQFQSAASARPLSREESMEKKKLDARSKAIEKEYIFAYDQAARRQSKDKGPHLGRSTNPEVKKIEDDILKIYGVCVMFGNDSKTANETLEILKEVDGRGDKCPPMVFIRKQTFSNPDCGSCESATNRVHIFIDNRKSSDAPLTLMLPDRQIPLVFGGSSYRTTLLHETGHCNDESPALVTEYAMQMAKQLNKINADSGKLAILIRQTCSKFIQSGLSSWLPSCLFPVFRGFSCVAKALRGEVTQLLTAIDGHGIQISQELRTMLQEYANGNGTDVSRIHATLSNIAYDWPRRTTYETVDQEFKENEKILDETFQKKDVDGFWHKLGGSLVVMLKNDMQRGVFVPWIQSFRDESSTETKETLDTSFYALISLSEAAAEKYAKQHSAKKSDTEGTLQPTLVEV